ncbi:MAG: ROK family protein [marine benthic group bacterium]|nr:ROK family protein [Gemmatimonadota bacterium]
MSDQNYIVGVDLGGTSIKVGVVPYDGGRVLGMRSMPTNSDHGAKFVVDRMVEMIRGSMQDAAREENIPDEGFIGIGLGSPGPLDRKTGTVIETPNLGWRNFPLRDLISNSIGLEAELDNDANCATIGEWWMGAGQGVQTLIGVTLGTGIGGGIVLDGRVFHGAADVAGEIGHMTIDSTGRKCKCGNYGCLEAYASGPAIAARAIEGLETGDTSLLPSLVNDDLSRITAETVYEAIVAGDLYAKEVMRETAKFLGAGLANLINILNPGMVVISGGVTRAGEHLFEPLRAQIRRRAFRHAEQSCQIVSTTLEGKAGVIGAAYMFRVERSGND